MSTHLAALERSRVLRSLAVTAIALAVGGCSLFPVKPALPQHAAIEHGAVPSGGTDYTALVTNAEVVYFPAERAASGAKSEPSARLLEALRRNGASFAIAWDLLDASQQSTLDELTGKTGATREEVIRRLKFAGSGRAREHCRAVLRDARLADLPHLALGFPPALIAKLETRERLTAEEEEMLPHGYSLPPGGLEAFAERATAGRGESSRSFGAQVASQQFAAEKIVRHFRASGMTTKLLVFVRGEDLEAGLGVPRYVGQKIPVRQLVLDSSGAATRRPKLLTARD